MTFTPYPNEVYTVFSFLGFIMCIIPLPWHLRAWNAGTCLYMFWAGAGCLISCINSMVWHGNAFDIAPIWCEICTRLVVGSSIGIPASSLCINRRLYLLQLDPRNAIIGTESGKMRSIAVDLGICVGLPILMMALQYIPQGHRFDIFEDIGCIPFIYNTWVGIVLINVPPVLVGLVSATYGIRAVISINKKRKNFTEFLSPHLNVTVSLYFRLMCLAGIEALLTVPIAGFYVIYNVPAIRPWISWEDTHSYFNRVDQYPAIIWHSFRGASAFEFSRWIYVICAILFFSFFGFAEEARYHYRLTIEFLLRCFRFRLDHRTETPITFMSQPDGLTFANKRRSRGHSFSTDPDSDYPKEGECFSWMGPDSRTSSAIRPPLLPQVVIENIPQLSLANKGMIENQV